MNRSLPFPFVVPNVPSSYSLDVFFWGEKLLSPLFPLKAFYSTNQPLYILVFSHLLSPPPPRCIDTPPAAAVPLQHRELVTGTQTLAASLAIPLTPS